MSSGFEAEEAAIMGRIKTLWGSTTPIKAENRELENPAGGNWIAPHIVNGGALKGALGKGSGSLERFDGVLICQLFAPDDAGTRVLKGLADDFASDFKDVQISSGDSGTITFEIPEIRTIGKADGFFQINVSIPFRRDRFEP